MSEYDTFLDSELELFYQALEDDYLTGDDYEDYEPNDYQDEDWDYEG